MTLIAAGFARYGLKDGVCHVFIIIVIQLYVDANCRHHTVRWARQRSAKRVSSPNTARDSTNSRLRSSQGLSQKMTRPGSQPPNPRVAIVIDDVGYAREPVFRLLGATNPIYFGLYARRRMEV